MSGEIEVENDKITWKCNGEKVAEVNLNQISIIGEYTVDSIHDDWFIVFVEKDGTWKRISMFAENVAELLIVLAEKFNPEIGKTQLTNSTKWNSVISYPELLRGKNLFKIVDRKIELEKDAVEYLAASH
jgi:hypothetical protein